MVPQVFQSPPESVLVPMSWLAPSCPTKHMEGTPFVPLLRDHGLPCLAFVVPWPGTMLGQGSGQTRATPFKTSFGVKQGLI